jgi:hypothetical protein
VGSYTNGDSLQTLIESWDGAAWSVVPSPNVTGENVLSGVSCLSARSCTAVGRSFLRDQQIETKTLIETWDGAVWSIVPSPSPGTLSSLLSGVSCISVTTCTAVGAYSNSGANQTLVESWDGAAWSVVPSPNVLGSDYLNGVSCISASSCTAVGNFVTSNSYGSVSQTLIESWDGTAWSVVPSPNVIGLVPSSLYGVSCISASSCTAVGFFVNGDVTQTLVENLVKSSSGPAWSIVPSPSPGTYDHLFGVSCLSASSCIAVGDYLGSSGPAQTLIESWDGAAWSVVPSPNVLGLGSYLRGVSCISASSCTAVGFYIGIFGHDHTLIESWDGATWSIVPSPSPGGVSVLSGASCISLTTCTAVGAYNNGGVGQTLVESWDGISWSVVPSPSPGTFPGLNGVSCISATSCTAAGSYSIGSFVSTLIETWDGTSWSVVRSPNPGTENRFASVSCVSATFCTAAGSYFNGSAVLTLIETWDGAAWSVVPSPSPGLFSNELRGVSCISASSCTAVGHYVNGSNIERTLIERSA